jgi:type IV pilus assembly protein PilN
MAKINLLPWREELRKKRQQDFLIAMGVGVGLTCVLFAVVYMHIESLKDYQNERNRRISDEITKVEKNISEIKDIEEKKLKLNEKIKLIQDLQESRPKIVQLFDELRKITPVGIYLTSLKQQGWEITVTGKSLSNAQVSEYMKAIDLSVSFMEPTLKFVKKDVKNDAKNDSNDSNDFTLMFKQKHDKSQEEDDSKDSKGKKPKGKPGAK